MDEKARPSVSLVQIQAVLWVLLIQHWCAHPLSGGRGSRRREGAHLLYRGVSHPPRSGGGGIMKEGGRDVRLVTITWPIGRGPSYPSRRSTPGTVE